MRGDYRVSRLYSLSGWMDRLMDLAGQDCVVYWDWEVEEEFVAQIIIIVIKILLLQEYLREEVASDNVFIFTQL